MQLRSCAFVDADQMRGPLAPRIWSWHTALRNYRAGDLERRHLVFIAAEGYGVPHVGAEVR